MLDRGDTAVLVAPVANFYRELDRMQLAPPRFRAVTSTNSFADETLQAELADLRAALHAAGKSSNDVERIVINHLGQRAKLQKFADAFTAWKESTPTVYENDEYQRGKPSGSQPPFPPVSAVDGLPGEFADYFEGAIAWSNPGVTDKTAARQAWERILKRPPEERHYKSTWAEFMLGRSWETEDPKKARDYFKHVRDLVAQGFSDPAGLAAASMGWEARLALRGNEFETAIDLYLQQYAADGWGAGESLQVAIARAVRIGPKALTPLALNPQARKLVTAYLISRHQWDEPTPSEIHDNIKAWLEAVEKADVKDVESAEQFALAAYQADEMELAIRWVNRAGNSPTAQWLTAKLLLRAGKVAKATAILSQIVDSFPTEQPTNDVSASFADGLSVPDSSEYVNIPAGRYIRGELGALRLSRREYEQSLDLLLRGDFWGDAAYVADRVLTSDELKNYVDANWPAIAPSEEENKSEDEKRLEKLTSNIRYLLARRLTRESRISEARAYYPAEWIPKADELMQSLTIGWDESLPGDQRANALAAAAFIARTNGMELIATEASPDWHTSEGEYREGVTADSRTNQEATVVFASPEELKRNDESKADPDKPYHYRYQAAALAWEAAKLMPNNSDETARLLCQAGSWIKAQDPIAADLFYKTLVRRCRKTAIGAEADEIRWFPDFDDDGNVVRTRLELLDLPDSQEINGAKEISDYPIPGKHFLVQPGDHVRYIVTAVRRLGVDITAKDIFAANPGMTPNDDIAGREIWIPSPQSGAAIQSAPEEPAPVVEDPSEALPNSGNYNGEQTGLSYNIQAGDTLTTIAKQHGVTIQGLLESNPELNSSRLKVGQEILIPGSNW
jgi:LysM repeat protein